MTLATYEPSNGEIRLTLLLGMTILSGYYSGYAQSLNLKGNERVLDFGSGSGICSRHIARILEKGGGRLDCLDASTRWQRVLRQTLQGYKNTACLCGRIGDVGLPEASYDTIVVHFVLHDIPREEWAAIAAEFGRVLKPGGRLILREPAGRGLEPEEIDEFAAEAGLRRLNLETRKIAIGRVYDAEFSYP